MYLINCCGRSQSTHPAAMGKCTWLYILSDDNEEYFYVGMTYRLVTRLQEHMAGEGAKATQKWKYSTVQAIYKIDEDRQHNHNVEDDLTLKLMKSRGGAWWKVRGGRWHQVKRMEKPCELIDTKCFPETCLCHFPVAEKVSKEGRAFMSCARKETDWLHKTSLEGVYEFAERDCNYFRWADE
jgi:predicted GIY-YIG superfamily endonuclease